jgi:streptomycin 6-kinase
VATASEIFRQRLDRVAGTTNRERKRLLKGIIACCGLSAT